VLLLEGEESPAPAEGQQQQQQRPQRGRPIAIGRVEEVFGPATHPLYALRYAGPQPPPASLAVNTRVFFTGVCCAVCVCVCECVRSCGCVVLVLVLVLAVATPLVGCAMLHRTHRDQ
jgi:hypothetical protein